MPTYNQRDKTRSAMSPPPQGDNYQAILQLQAAIRRLETDLETANRKLADTTSLANQHKRQLRGMNFVDSPTIHWDQSAGAIRAHGAAKEKKVTATGGRVYFSPQWQYDITTTESDPTSGLFRLNNTTIASSTKMYIDDIALNGLDMSTILEAISADAKIYIQGVGKSGQALIITVANVTDNTGWFTIDYTVDDHVGDAWTDLATFGFLFPLSAGGVLYDGPFAISIKSSSVVTIAAGSVYAGYTKVDFSEQDINAAGTATYYIYIRVSYASGYSLLPYQSATKVTQNSSYYYHPIGAMTVVSGVVSGVAQYHYGDIIISGRYV